MSTSPLLARLGDEGAVVVPIAATWETDAVGLARAAGASPFDVAERLLGERPLLVERQPIRPIDGGRSFASTRVHTPLHTDSQLFLGIPAAVQILFCVHQAPRGGESVLLDGERLLDRLAREDEQLCSALFDAPRTQRFYFGDVVGPTVALRGGHLAWTVSPSASDPLGQKLRAACANEAPRIVRLREGEALVASNHRMLHGRTAFEGERELVRLLVWLERPLAAERRWVSRAREIAPAPPPAVVARLRAVLAIVRGAPPARTAKEAGVDEATLYAWRDAFVRGGIAALGG